MAANEVWIDEHEIRLEELPDRHAEPEDPAPEETVEDWVQRLVADDSLWQPLEVAFRDGDTVLEGYGFSSIEHLSVAVIRNGETRHLVTFSPV